MRRGRIAEDRVAGYRRRGVIMISDGKGVVPFVIDILILGRIDVIGLKSASDEVGKFLLPRHSREQNPPSELRKLPRRVSGRRVS